MHILPKSMDRWMGRWHSSSKEPGGRALGSAWAIKEGIYMSPSDSADDLRSMASEGFSPIRLRSIFKYSGGGGKAIKTT